MRGIEALGSATMTLAARGYDRTLLTQIDASTRATDERTLVARAAQRAITRFLNRSE
jgi:hypothetical protein